MNILLPFLISSIAAAPGEWADPQTNAWTGSPANIEYGPWIPQNNYERDSKGIVGTLTSIMPSTDTLRNIGNFWDWDRSTVYEGIFKNENIMTHVGQNFFNFIVTTLAWFTVSQLYSSGIAADQLILTWMGGFYIFIFASLAAFTTREIVLAGIDGKVDVPRNARAITISEAADEVLSAIREFQMKHEE